MTLHPRPATVGILATLVVMRPERRSTASHQPPPSAQKEESRDLDGSGLPQSLRSPRSRSPRRR